MPAETSAWVAHFWADGAECSEWVAHFWAGGSETSEWVARKYRPGFICFFVKPMNNNHLFYIF
jgi:hypothetical protein